MKGKDKPWTRQQLADRVIVLKRAKQIERDLLQGFPRPTSADIRRILKSTALQLAELEFRSLTRQLTRAI